MVYQLDKPEMASWVIREKNTFTAGFGGTAVMRERAILVIVEFVLVVHSPDALAENRRIKGTLGSKRGCVTSRNTHVTLLTNLGQFRTCHIPCHTPALVPPRNSSTLEALLSQLHTDSQDSWNLVPHSNSGITNTDLNITVSSLVPVPVPVLILVPVPVPCSDIAFLCFPSCTHHFPVFRSIF